MQRGQSTLEWVIGAAVILGTIATQRDHSPRPFWGRPGDPQLDAMTAATPAGKMMFRGGGRHPIVTSHVVSAVRAIRLALRHWHMGRRCSGEPQQARQPPHRL
jgi:hypothetical protein